MSIKSKSALFYPEDKIAVSFSVLIIAVQMSYYLTGFLKESSEVLTPFILFVVLLILIFLRKKSSSQILRFVGSYFHIPYYGIIFSAFQTFVHKLNPNDYDVLLLKWDYTLFDFDITRWLEQFTTAGLTEILTLSYFSYYILPTMTFVLLYFSRSDSAFLKARNYLLAIVIGWYSAFLFYMLLPAAGPDIAFPENYKVPLQGLSPLVNYYLDTLGKYLRESYVRNTFPSMHFGIILITNYFAFIYKRKYFLFCTLPLGLLLAIATVYLRQHYLVDLLGSFPIAAISIYFALKINKKYKTKGA